MSIESEQHASDSAYFAGRTGLPPVNYSNSSYLDGVNDRIISEMGRVDGSGVHYTGGSGSLASGIIGFFVLGVGIFIAYSYFSNYFYIYNLHDPTSYNISSIYIAEVEGVNNKAKLRSRWNKFSCLEAQDICTPENTVRLGTIDTIVATKMNENWYKLYFRCWADKSCTAYIKRGNPDADG